MADAATTDRLIGQLADFRTRRAARLELVRLGAEAVEPLLGLLTSVNEALLWCAIQSLAEIGDDRAVAPLIETVRRGRLADRAAEALATLTGQDLGAHVELWDEWAKQKGAGGPQATDESGLEPNVLMARVVEGTAMTCTTADDVATVIASLPDGRQQTVKVLFSSKDPDGDDLVVVYSECGPADSSHYEAVLRRNLRIPYGSYGLRDVDGEPTFVMCDTLLRNSVTAQALRKSVTTIASRADKVEKALTGEDER